MQLRDLIFLNHASIQSLLERAKRKSLMSLVQREVYFYNRIHEKRFKQGTRRLRQILAFQSQPLYKILKILTKLSEKGIPCVLKHFQVILVARKTLACTTFDSVVKNSYVALEGLDHCCFTYCSIVAVQKGRYHYSEKDGA